MPCASTSRGPLSALTRRLPATNGFWCIGSHLVLLKKLMTKQLFTLFWSLSEPCHCNLFTLFSPACRFVLSVLFGKALVNCCGGVAMDWKFFPRASYVKSRCLTSLSCTCPRSGRNPDEAGSKPSMVYARKCEHGFIKACDLSTHLATGSPLQAQRSPKWDYQLQTHQS